MRRLAPALLAASLFIAACSDQGTQAPTPTDITTPDATLVNPAGCPSDAQMAVQIHNLFPRPLEAVAAIKYAAIRAAMIANKTPLARQIMYATVDWALKQYNAGSLIGGKSAATQAKMTTFINSLYCIVGLPAPTIPPGSLGPDGAAAIVSPSSTPTPVVTGNGLAGVQIPGGGVTVPTLITVSKIPGALLPTQLDQYGVYEFTASPALPGVNDAVVGFCIEDILPSTVQVAHQVSQTAIEILPKVPADFLGCSTSFSSRLGPNPTLQEYARWGLARAGQALLTVLAPAALNASIVGQTGVGGKTKGLSPFGVVDPRISVAAASLTTISGVAGSSVPSDALPSVQLATPLGHLVSGYSVAFSVVDGSEGAITGNAQTTNASGIATVGSWTLGLDLVPNLVNATVAPSQPEIVINGSPVLFTANVISTTVVSYQSSGYSYQLIGNDVPPTATSWETTSYTGAANWPVGAGGFGFNFSADQCSIVSEIQTGWPGALTTSSPSQPSNTSGLLLRKSITIPNGWTGSLSIGVAIDNDVQVFVNGVDITASAGATVGGFQVHEGCATRGSLVFSASNGNLVPGASNLIAVYARDRGRTSYFDMEVKLVPAD